MRMRTDSEGGITSFFVAKDRMPLKIDWSQQFMGQKPWHEVWQARGQSVRRKALWLALGGE